ncbi:hypothetical protein, partial [Aquipseudomonas alcaligenes]|uniref:hypothetical protein n=1 Tax=Aquipseudomonas alcaligenes TaxID=43263 RepID=UPI001C82420C
SRATPEPAHPVRPDGATPASTALTEPSSALPDVHLQYLTESEFLFLFSEQYAQQQRRRSPP